MGEKFRWEDHETELNRIFFKEFTLFKRLVMVWVGRKSLLTLYRPHRRDSNQVHDFWAFLKRYQQFQAKHQLTSERGTDAFW